MTTSADPQVEQFREFHRDELEAAYLYRAMAENAGRSQLADFYRSIADAEDRHAAYWASRLYRLGVRVERSRPGFRALVLAWTARRFGAKVVVPIMARKEAAERFNYERSLGDKPFSMAAEERSHARLIGLARHRDLGRFDGASLARMDGRPRVVGGNALRAAVLGGNDGLLSNTSLVVGVAGAEFSSDAVLVAGLAGLLAGAISMALGEWVSVQSSRELHRYHVGLAQGNGHRHLAPPEEAEQLALLFEADGMTEDEALERATKTVSEMNSALREGDGELDIDVEEADDSNPWTAAGVSFVLFALGAFVPVVPFMLWTGTTAVIVALVAAGVGLFSIGGVITLFTGRSVLMSGGRQLVTGIAAALFTYFVGKVIGVNISG